MEVRLRDPKSLMKLSKLGSFHQSKLSFLRSFLNEFKEWDYNRDLFQLNENGHDIPPEIAHILINLVKSLTSLQHLRIWTTMQTLMIEKRNIIGDNHYPYMLEGFETVDIDDEKDFLLAEILYKMEKSSANS